jgi:hypothetical protein
MILKYENYIEIENRRGSYWMRRGSCCSASACCEAGTSSSSSSAPQRRPFTERKLYEDNKRVLDVKYILTMYVYSINVKINIRMAAYHQTFDVIIPTSNGGFPVITSTFQYNKKCLTMGFNSHNTEIYIYCICTLTLLPKGVQIK